MKNGVFIENLDIVISDGFFSKFFGLMGKKNFDYGLLLKNTNGIHTFFMREDIDVVLLDKDFKVLKVYEDVKPWKVILPKRNVKHVLELPKGYSKHIKTQ